jgi:hypothetical protein
VIFYGVRSRLWTAATDGHIVHPPDDMSLESDGGMILTGENRITRRETCPNATLSTTNPTWIDPGVNPGLRCERPGTILLSHGPALDRRLECNYCNFSARFIVRTRRTNNRNFSCCLVNEHWCQCLYKIAENSLETFYIYILQLQVYLSIPVQLCDLGYYVPILIWENQPKYILWRKQRKQGI